MQRNRRVLVFCTVLLASLLTGCFSFRDYGELRTAETVDLSQVEGSYYVVGAMTTPLDRDPSDATFNFFRSRDGTFAIEYAFRPKGLDSELKTYRGRARVSENSADWDIRFVWPFQNDYKVIYAADDYSLLMIGHPSRKNLYILSREKTIEQVELQWLLDLAASQGYHTSSLERIDHR
ncbi:MAG: lipocalin family protein [Opitutales bacterium]